MPKTKTPILLGLVCLAPIAFTEAYQYPVHTKMYDSSGTFTKGEHIKGIGEINYETIDLDNENQVIKTTTSPSQAHPYVTTTYAFPNGAVITENYSLTGSTLQLTPSTSPTYYSSRPNLQYQGQPVVSASRNGDGTATVTGVFGNSTQITETTPFAGTTDYTGSYGHTISTSSQNGNLILTGPMGVEMGTYTPGVGYISSGNAKTFSVANELQSPEKNLWASSQEILLSMPHTSNQTGIVTLDNGQTIAKTVTPSSYIYTLPNGHQIVESYTPYGISSIETVPTTYTTRPDLQYEGQPLISASRSGNGTATVGGIFGNSTQITETTPFAGTTDYTGSYGHTISTNSQNGTLTFVGPTGVEMGTYIPGVGYTPSSSRGVSVTQNEPYYGDPTSIQTLNSGVPLFSATYNSYGEMMSATGVRGMSVQATFPDPTNGWDSYYVLYNNGVNEGTYTRQDSTLTGPNGGYVSRGNGQIIWQSPSPSN